MNYSFQETVVKEKVIDRFKNKIDTLEKDKINLKNKLYENENQKTSYMIKIQKENNELKRRFEEYSLENKHHTTLHEEKLYLLNEKKVIEANFVNKIEKYEEKIRSLQKYIENYKQSPNSQLQNYQQSPNSQLQNYQPKALINTNFDEEVLRLNRIIKDLEFKIINIELGKVNDGSQADYIKVLQIENDKNQQEIQR